MRQLQQRESHVYLTSLIGGGCRAYVSMDDWSGFRSEQAVCGQELSQLLLGTRRDDRSLHSVFSEAMH